MFIFTIFTLITLPQNCIPPLPSIQDLEKSLAEYQPTIAELNSRVEPLRAEGQISQAEDILRLTSQYELLIDRVAGCRSSRQAALAVRQQHEGQLAKIQKALEDGRKELESVTDMGVTVPERLQKYKVNWALCVDYTDRLFLR